MGRARAAWSPVVEHGVVVAVVGVDEDVGVAALAAGGRVRGQVLGHLPVLAVGRLEAAQRQVEAAPERSPVHAPLQLSLAADIFI